jgi:RHS repeat-associated protein
MSLAYDRNGNVTSRDGTSQQWASFNLPTSLQKSGYQSQFSYSPDHRRWRQVATYQNGTETTHYVGGRLEKESTTSSGLTYWRHYVPTPSGDGIVVSRDSNASTSTTFVLADHLGSGDTLLDESGAVKSRLSYSAFGARRGSNWSATTAPDWLGIATQTRRGYTSHEMLDNVGIVHMNGRVYDPQLGRFLSTDPIIGNLGDSQSVNAYAYVGNRPLVTTDPSGLVPADGGIVSCPVVAAIFRTAVNFMGHHAALPPPPATAQPGQSAQSGVGLCGSGTFSPTCGGVVLYAGVPGASGSPFNGGALPLEELYALENLEQFFVDLGINAVDVLILSPIRDVETAVGAARHGDFGTAAMYGGFAACGAVHACKAIQAPLKAVKRSAQATRSASVVGTRTGPVVVGETMVRVRAASRTLPDSRILDDMPDFAASRLKPHEVTSAMMRFNRDWILRQLRSGRTIVDIGADPNRTVPSIFYEMERNMIKNYGKLHPATEAIPTP